MAFHSVRRRSLASLALALLALGLALGCRTEQREARKAEQRRLTLEMWRELVEKGTLSPVDSMEDPFERFSAEMGVTPEDYRKLGMEPPDQPGLAEGPVKTEKTPAEDVKAEPGGEVDLPVDSYPLVDPTGDAAPVSTIEPPPNYYQKFGSRIVVHKHTGLITKIYPMPTKAAVNLERFILQYSGFPLWIEEGPQAPDTILVERMEGMEVEFLSKNMRGSGPAPGTDITMGDWFVVTASPTLLEEVEAFIDLFAAGPPQIEIEAKIVEWVVRDTLDLGVSDVSAIFPTNTLVEDIGWNFPSTGSIDTTGGWFAGISAIHDGVTYAAMFEAMAAYDNVSIIQRPKVAVRDGTKAKIEALTKVPFIKVGAINNQGVATTTLDFQSVGVQLYVTPRLVGTGTIALQIDIEASQQTGSAVTLTTGAGQVSTPILSTRTAETVVYLKPQQAVILGGLISEQVIEEETGVPLLMDLPLLGYLFKSTLESTENTTLLFFIRPRLIEGTDLNQPF
jgi:hypothetical protein